MSSKKSILIKAFLALFIFSLGIAVGLLLALQKTLPNTVVPVEQTKSEDVVQEIVATPTIINPTANWSTYRNQKYGFEFRYPSTIVKSGNDNGSTFRVNFDDTIKVNQWTLRAFANTSIQEYLSDPYNDVTVEKITPGQIVNLNEKEFKEYSILPIDGKPEKCLLSEFGKDIVELCNFPQDILDTFKIVK